ncbi:MAG: hypothetical protein RID22_14945 [Roseibium aggregatum]|uniref:hypothetical protein n=1 Tax=uncultured Roseibium sp. TaxID=1936171 RepID=UPI0026035848|nr:hypothetical protein [uncultured Roseibium sp.]
MGDMNSAKSSLGKLFASLFLALTIALAGWMPAVSAPDVMNHEAAAVQLSPCNQVAVHDTHSDMSDVAGMDINPSADICCSSTSCTGDTVRLADVRLAGELYQVVFPQVQPAALQLAEFVLPHRPPRFL